MRHPVLRSGPWTLALATILAAFVALGVFGLLVRTSLVEIVFSLVVVALAGLGLARVINSGVVITPSGLIIRELTRTTMIEWAGIRAVESGPGERRGVFAPALRLATRADVRGRPLPERLELTILAAWSAPVAQRRADVLAEALASRRTPRRRR